MSIVHDSKIEFPSYGSIQYPSQKNIPKSKHYFVKNVTIDSTQIEDSKFMVYTGFIKSIYFRNIEKLKSSLQSIKKKQWNDLINFQDKLGNTPLMYNIKANYLIPQEQLEIAKLLVENGADPKIKDNENTTPYTEACFQDKYNLAYFLYSEMGGSQQKLLDRIKNLQIQLDDSLNNMGDFYIEMSFKIDNGFIPLIQYWAPNDTIKIWKHKKNLQTSQTFAGYDQNNKLKGILRKQYGFIFNSLDYLQQQDFHNQLIFYSNELEIWAELFNKPSISNLIQGNIEFLKRQQLRYNENPNQKDGFLIVDDIQHERSRNFLGNKVQKKSKKSKQIKKKYDFIVSSHLCLEKKKTADYINSVFQYYCQNHLHDESHPIFQENTLSKIQINSFNNTNNISIQQQQQPQKIISNQQKQENIQQNNENENLNNQKQYEIQQLDKKKLQLWIEENYPIKFQDFYPILRFIIQLQIQQDKDEGEEKPHPFLENLIQILDNQNIQDLFKQEGFPVQIEVPLQYNFYALVKFKAVRIIKDLDTEHQLYPNLFKIQKDFLKVSQKNAFLIMQGEQANSIKAKYQNLKNNENQSTNDKDNIEKDQNELEEQREPIDKQENKNDYDKFININMSGYNSDYDFPENFTKEYCETERDRYVSQFRQYNSKSIYNNFQKENQ